MIRRPPRSTQSSRRQRQMCIREDLVARGEMERVMGSRTSAGCPRSTGLDAINALYSVAFEVDQKHGTGYLERFKNWLRRVEENDLAVSGAMTDVKGDRSKRPSEQDDPVSYTHLTLPTI